MPLHLLPGHQARRRAAALVAESGDRPGASRLDVVSPEQLAAAAVSVLATTLLFGPVAIPVLGAAGVVGWLGWRSSVRSRVRRRRRAQLPESLERMATALRTGSSLPQALAAAAAATEAPLGPELQGLVREADRGRPVVESLDRWTSAHDDVGTRLVATALTLAATIGAAPARAVDGVAATLREHEELGAERRALATQARVSALVLSLAPLVFAALLAVTDPAAARFLLRTPLGWTCTVVGVGLDVAGAVWMARLTRGPQP